MNVARSEGGVWAPPPVRVLVAAPAPSLTAGLAALVRDSGFKVVAERRKIDEPSALDAVNVAVVAAGTVIAIDAFPVGAPGVVVPAQLRARRPVPEENAHPPRLHMLCPPGVHGRAAVAA